MMRKIKRMAPSHEAIAEVAKKASNDPEGLIVKFYFDQYPSQEDAKRAARAFQIAFAAMRSRKRAQAMRMTKTLNGYVDEATFQGPFDHLGAYLREGPDNDRWEVRLFTANADPMVIEYASTGKVVREFTPAGRRWTALVSKVVDALTLAEKAGMKPVNVLTDEEAAFMLAYDADAYRELWVDFGEEPYAPQQEPQERVG